MADQDSKYYIPKRPHPLTLVLGALAVLAIVVIAGGMVLARNAQLRRQGEALTAAAAQARTIMVVPVLYSPTQHEIKVPGSTAGYNDTFIYAKIPGYLKSIKVDKGDFVKAGQVLAVIDSPETDKAVADAEANYWLQKTTDERNQRLVKLGVVAQQTADQSHAMMLQAKNAWLQLKATQAYEIIRAPFAGMITARNVDPGALIPQATTNTPATALLELSSVQPLRVYAQLPQSQALFVHDGDHAVVTVPEMPDRDFVGSVTRHSRMLTEATRTMLVEVDLPNTDSALYPGMYATVKFSLTSNLGAPLAPDGSLVFQEGKSYLPVVRGNNLRLIPVELGYDDGINVEILHGAIQHGDLVAINLGQAVEDGEAVKPVLAPSLSAHKVPASGQAALEHQASSK
jgi:membrane fusion protein (multidrug efflux system)